MLNYTYLLGPLLRLYVPSPYWLIPEPQAIGVQELREEKEREEQASKLAWSIY
jgi:hypothetical protein